MRIQCNDKQCQANAAKMGLTAPLAATIPDALAHLAKTPQGRHGLVHMAHDPNALTGAAARARTGVAAA